MSVCIVSLKKLWKLARVFIGFHEWEDTIRSGAMLLEALEKNHALGSHGTLHWILIVHWVLPPPVLRVQGSAWLEGFSFRCF